MSKNQRAQNLAYDWIKWLRTKSFYGRPMPKHILAVLSMPDTSGEPPDAPLSVELAAFHAGVTRLPAELGRPFLRVYCDCPKAPIKVLADQERVGRDTYYARAHKGAKMALIGMHHALMMAEGLGVKV